MHTDALLDMMSSYLDGDEPAVTVLVDDSGKLRTRRKK